MPTWIYREIGCAILTEGLSETRGRPVSAEELYATYDEARCAAAGRHWCQTNPGQLYLLAKAATRAEQLSQRGLDFGREYIRREGPVILEQMPESAARAWLLNYVQTGGEGNREQFITIFLGSLRQLVL